MVQTRPDAAADAPRLYLVAPPELSPAALAVQLAAACAAADAAGEEIGCLLLRRPVGASDSEWREAVAAVLPILRDRDVALMLEDRADLVRRLDADGAHLSHPDPAALAAARQRIGDLNLGVYCDASRHDAIEAAEAGADYVAFAADCPEIAWWAQMMTPPCVAWLSDAPILDQGAEFVARGI